MVFGTDVRLIGMVHVGALPGTPRAGLSVERLAERAVDEAKALVTAGFDAVMVENMHDLPYLRRDVGPEVVAAMTRVVGAVRAAIDVPIGVQILAGANRAALAVAHATGASFIRAEGFVFASVADEGLLDEADAAPLLRERRRIGAEGVKILADVKKKHSSHALTADISPAEFAQAAEFCGADGVVVTGGATGQPTSVSDVRAVRDGVQIPVLVGSGVTVDTTGPLLDYAHTLIVGSATKRDGRWSEPVDADRAKAIVEAAKEE